MNNGEYYPAYGSVSASSDAGYSIAIDQTGSTILTWSSKTVQGWKNVSISVWSRNGSVWSLQLDRRSVDPALDLVSCLALRPDGNFAVTSYSGAIATMIRSGSEWGSMTTIPIPGFLPVQTSPTVRKYSCAFEQSGSWFVAASAGTAAGLYIYQWTGNSITFHSSLTTNMQDMSNMMTVVFLADAMTIGVSTYSGSGSDFRVNIYYRSSTSSVTWLEASPIPQSATGATANAWFGSCLAVSNDVMIIGEELYANRVGRSHIFRKGDNNQTWNFVQTITGSPIVGSSNLQGSSCDIKGKTIVIGAPEDNGKYGAFFTFVSP